MKRQRGQVQLEAMALAAMVGVVGVIALSSVGIAARSAVAGDAAAGNGALAVSSQAAVASGVTSFVRAADAALLESRPTLVAAKYEKMASSPFLFFRGILPMYLADWNEGRASATRFAHEELVLSAGDAHPGNFGMLRGTDGKFRLETNDFDTVGKYPYLWDVRRMTAGLAVALREANAPWRVVDRVSTKAALGYQDTLRAGKATISVAERRAFPAEAMRGAGNVPSRYLRDDGRAFVRGVVRDQEVKDVSADVRSLVMDLTARYGTNQPAGGPSVGAVLDVVALEGKGVSSLPVHRWLALVDAGRGKTQVVEWKEIIERQTMYFFEPRTAGVGLADDVAGRIAESFAHRKSGADWRVVSAGEDHYLGRVLYPGQSSLKFERWANASAADVDALAYSLGVSLGQSHLRSDSLRAFMGGMGKGQRNAWVKEQAEFARTYGSRVLDAFEEFQSAVGTP